MINALCRPAAFSYLSEAVSQRSPWTNAPSKLWALPGLQCSRSGVCDARFLHILVSFQNVGINIIYLFFLFMKNPSKVSVKERLGFSSKPAAPVEKVTLCSEFLFLGGSVLLLQIMWNPLCNNSSPLSQVFSTSMGLTKTVYNPVALKAAQKTSEEALKKKQVRGEKRGNGRKRYFKGRKLLVSHTENMTLFTGSSETTAGRTEEEAGDIGEAHWDTKGEKRIKTLIYSSVPINWQHLDLQPSSTQINSQHGSYKRSLTRLWSNTRRQSPWASQWTALICLCC